MTVEQESATRVVILTPVFNDWQNLGKLLPQIDATLRESDLFADMLIVDDGSSESMPTDLIHAQYERIEDIDIISLNCNLGHQRAIAVGLTYLAKHEIARTVVVMDSDGEDMTSDVPRLVRLLAEEPAVDVVFAERLKRSESMLFRAGYAGYRLLHLVLTGLHVRYGNFSAIRPRAIRQLIYSGALWNHYCAAVIHSRLRYDAIPTARGRRYSGVSNFSLGQLMVHGFGALSVFSDVICGRLFGGAAVLMTAFFVAVGVLFHSGMLPAPSLIMWGTLGMLVLLSFVLNVIALIALRSFPSFIPARDTGIYIKSVNRIYPTGRGDVTNAGA